MLNVKRVMSLVASWAEDTVIALVVDAGSSPA